MLPLSREPRDLPLPSAADERSPEAYEDLAPDAAPRPLSLFERVALAQGAYYVLTGLWPFVSVRAFQSVTGAKTDIWLVKVVGALVAVIGAVLLRSRRAGSPSPEAIALGAGSAAALGVVELRYAATRRISFVYALDAIAQFAIVACWWTIVRERRPHSEIIYEERVSVRSEISS